MYGVPADLDLSIFHGDYLTQIGIGQYDLQFVFGRGGVISVWGHWELRAADGHLLDWAQEHAEREAYGVHFVLGKSVVSWQDDPPKSLTLTFDGGMVLTVFDDSEQYESFSINPGNIIV